MIRAVVRGGGDLATGVVQKLWRAGCQVAILETENPLAIRRTVALCTAVTESVAAVEDVTARLATVSQCEYLWRQGEIPVIVDPAGASLSELRPTVLVDAILAKRNLGTHHGMAPVTIALGPGFTAPDHVDAVIETMRGHDLGRLILRGAALPNTGIPGELGGVTARRVVHAPVAGAVTHIHKIGDRVALGEPLFTLDGIPVCSPLTGTLRGLIAAGLTIPAGLKCADVDPRPEREINCFTISDKARNLGGAVLEGALYLLRIKGISHLT